MIHQLRIYEIFERNKAAFHARFRDMHDLKRNLASEREAGEGELLRRLFQDSGSHIRYCRLLCYAGDGNIHVNVLIDRRKPGEEERSHAAVKEIFGAALDLGGTLSGEHGIGITKAPYLSMELGDMGMEVMKRIKRSFDPNNVLNPGKIFPGGVGGLGAPAR
jgi:FAD/FMN-containing dehydrogenase